MRRAAFRLGRRIDYFRYINEVEGGINGVKLFWDECETKWEVEKGVECYERLKAGKNGSPVPIFLPHGDPISKALTEKSVADKIPLTIAYGPTEAIDGRVSPMLPADVELLERGLVGDQLHRRKVEGGKDKLKGLKIATVYHDSPYGKETQVPLALLAKTYGFEDIQIPVPHPGNDQSAQWAKIRQIKPDWVFLRGWGVMTPVAIKTAAKIGFPVDHIIGGIWSSSEEDVRPAGAVGKGYLAITPFPAGSNFEIHQQLKKYILDKGLSDLKDPKSFGSVYYNSGVDEAIIAVEAIRTAQAHSDEVEIDSGTLGGRPRGLCAGTRPAGAPGSSQRRRPRRSKRSRRSPRRQRSRRSRRRKPCLPSRRSRRGKRRRRRRCSSPATT